MTWCAMLKISAHDDAATDAVENYFGELAEGLNNFWPLT
jgi:hypothetical protein